AAWSRFMVPMRDHRTKEALHEPRAKAGASSKHSKRCRAVNERPGLREALGVRPACRRFPQFIVPMHAPKRKEATQEPAGCGNSHESSAESVAKRFGDLDKRLTERCLGLGNRHRHTAVAANADFGVNGDFTQKRYLLPLRFRPPAAVTKDLNSL